MLLAIGQSPAILPLDPLFHVKLGSVITGQVAAT